MTKIYRRARHIAELFLRISTRRTNHCHPGQVFSEARPARRNVLLPILQFRPLRARTPGRIFLRSTLPHHFPHPMLADLLAMPDPLPPRRWMLPLYDDTEIQIIALVPSTSPKHLNAPMLCNQPSQISFLLRCAFRYQTSIVISHPSFA